MSFIGMLENASPGSSSIVFLVQAAEDEYKHFSNLLELVLVTMQEIDVVNQSQEDNSDLAWPVLSMSPLAIIQIAPKDQLHGYLETLKDQLLFSLSRYDKLKRNGTIARLLYSVNEEDEDDDVPPNECIVGEE